MGWGGAKSEGETASAYGSLKTFGLTNACGSTRVVGLRLWAATVVSLVDAVKFSTDAVLLPEGLRINVLGRRSDVYAVTSLADEGFWVKVLGWHSDVLSG